MIVKVLTRHTPSFGSLLRYILKGSDAESPQVFTHNLRSKTVPGWTAEFLANESLRRQNRSNQIYLYHEIISFSNKDSHKLTNEMLSDFAQRYILFRGTSGMYMGAVHRDTSHTHIHFCTSGLEYRTGTSFRLSHTRLDKLKTELQLYQTRTYPQLSESICRHGMRENKTVLRDTLSGLFTQSHTQEDFFSQLRGKGLHHYERKGRIEGVVDESGRKHRFSRLGVDVNSLPQNHSEILNALKEIRILRESENKESVIEH
ncbi:MAG: relaxase/mobilization nuclease domain-containing protein [Bacteroidia bacterium]|nr:relaxase/mobilization nuclease domain-containing protein [Bacteroidia bacterium]